MEYAKETMMFKDRTQAGAMLAEQLRTFQNRNAVIYALPRGGVILGAEVAKALGAPLDLIITRKVGAPGDPEYAMCAVTEVGEPICDPLERARVDPEWLEKAISEERKEAKRRREKYLKNRKPISCEEKIAVIVDDGIATGLTMRAAVKALRAQKPKAIIVAVPVAPADTVNVLESEADKVVVLDNPDQFLGAVGAHYDDFSQVSDSEVIELLKEAST